MLAEQANMLGRQEKCWLKNEQKNFHIKINNKNFHIKMNKKITKV